MKQSGRDVHNRKDYFIAIDMAKELAMAERTEPGRCHPEVNSINFGMLAAAELPKMPSLRLGRTLGVGYRRIIYRSS